MSRRFLVWGGIIAAIAIFGGFLFYKTNFSQGITISIVPPENILIGVPFDALVNVSNNSREILQKVRLSVSLPEGMAFVGSPVSKTVDFRDLSNLGVGGLSQQTFKLIVLNGEGSFKQVSASAAYSSGSLSSRFEESSDASLSIGGYGLMLDIATPQKVFSGESFDTEISFKNESGNDLSDLKLKMEYPLTFTFGKSTLTPDTGNNIWILGGLRQGSDMKFKITGNVIGPEGSFFDMKAMIESVFQGQSYPISVKTGTVSIATSPLSLKIELNGDQDFIAAPGSDLRYTLSYTNNTDVGLKDVIIKAQLAGAMFDMTSVSSKGAFRSTDNSVVWTAASVPSLVNLPPGQSGSVDFSVRAKSDYPIKRLSDKNFILKVTGSIESPTVPHFVESEKTTGFAILESKVQGKIDIDAKGYFRDASSGILNAGTMPPKVNKATQYTIHWVITNYAADAKDVEVRAFLAGNVKFTGVLKSNAASAPTFNDRTQEIVWNLSKVGATTGITGKPIEAVFQIEAMPSVSDVGRAMNLIQETSLKAVDEFTGIQLSDKDTGINTTLPDDSTVAGQGTVIQ